VALHLEDELRQLQAFALHVDLVGNRRPDRRRLPVDALQELLPLELAHTSTSHARSKSPGAP